MTTSECRHRDDKGRCRCQDADHGVVSPYDGAPVRRFLRDAEALPDVRAILNEIGRGSLQRRAEDMAKLVAERDAEIAGLRELLTRIEAYQNDMPPEGYATWLRGAIERMNPRHVSLVFAALALAIGLLAGCGGSLDVTCVRPPIKGAPICTPRPTLILDNADHTNSCPGIDVPATGCTVGNNGQGLLFCVPECP